MIYANVKVQHAHKIKLKFSPIMSACINHCSKQKENYLAFRCDISKPLLYIGHTTLSLTHIEMTCSNSERRSVANVTVQSNVCYIENLL